MPARSQAQRAYLNATKGHAWVKAHGYDNKGKLPAKLGGKKTKKVAVKKTAKHRGAKRRGSK